MASDTDLLKDGDLERPIPTAWRKTFREVIEAFKAGDFALERGIANVDPISNTDARFLKDTVAAYGETLISLPEEAWTTSRCRWMESHWDVMVDLFTAESGASDLVLFAQVHEAGSSFRFELSSLHVP